MSDMADEELEKERKLFDVALREFRLRIFVRKTLLGKAEAFEIAAT